MANPGELFNLKKLADLTIKIAGTAVQFTFCHKFCSMYIAALLLSAAEHTRPDNAARAVNLNKPDGEKNEISSQVVIGCGRPRGFGIHLAGSCR
jgi:hypothetical protein